MPPLMFLSMLRMKGVVAVMREDALRLGEFRLIAVLANSAAAEVALLSGSQSAGLQIWA